MSYLHTYQIQGARASLRVDASELDWLAEGLYSACHCARESCSPTASADLSWDDCGSGRFRLSLAGKEIEAGLGEAELYFQSEHLLNQLFARRLAHLLKLHAAVVADPAGRAWLLCGPSGAGKTSLAVGLILRGWQWLSDELALVDAGDLTRILGFRRNFNLKESSFALFPETAAGPHAREFFSSYRRQRVRFFDPEDFAPGSAREEARLAGVIFPRFDPEAVVSQVSRKPGLEAVQGMLAEMAGWQPWGLTFLSNAAHELPAFDFVYAHPRRLEPLLEAASLANPGVRSA